MNTIKEFLKPNRWKVGIFGIIIIIGNLPALCIVMVWWKFTYLIVSHRPENLPPPVAFCEAVSLPIHKFLLLTFLFSKSNYELPFSPYAGPIVFSTVIIYWFLLSCFIYFIFRKFKKKAL